jgi:NADH dehydrogenase
MRGADTLYNTYWIRYELGGTTFDQAVDNTRTLLEAAAQAGIRRIAHVSVTNPSPSSSLRYYRGKAQCEQIVTGLGLSYAIVRPTLIYGKGGILVNNIAWLLRHLPAFGVPADGTYRVQPVFIDDFARSTVAAGGSADDIVVDIAGPEMLSFLDLVREVRAAVRSRAFLFRTPPGVALLAARLVGATLRDVVLTRAEVDGLMAELLVSRAPPLGRTLFADALGSEAGQLGRHYASELSLHFRPPR